ncbi:hypothetical protein Hypma_009253 [Hypsizygus marmoreus]|uniref:Uncharacterized protein n=1 Tax=Hypsizygus marmoreus TaxID=39966 RepID=A0A369JXY8_HYPMA|nr:hypothetical protein Hypma_009253 [Hypsizygus marmoreus]
MASFTKADRDEQPQITIVNIHKVINPQFLRMHHPDVSSPSTLVKLAQFLQAEDALIINVSLSPQHLCVVAALKEDGWHERLQLSDEEDWAHA